MSALLHFQNVAFARRGALLFEQLSAAIHTDDRVGLVGHNGSGKSTLLALLAGAEQPDDGEVRRRRGLRIGVVEQFVPGRLADVTLQDAVLDVLPERTRIEQSYRAPALLAELGFRQQQLDQALAQLSGGEQTLALLARALLAEPELLLMDEPGNHMDLIALARLRQTLSHPPCPFVMVSHDRELLDQCCTRTLFLRDRTLYSFALPYSDAKAALAAHDEQAARRRQAEDKEIRRLQTSAKRLAHWGKVYDNESLSKKAKTMQLRATRLDAEKTELSEGSGLDLQLQIERLKTKSVLTLEKLQVHTPDRSRQLLSCEFLHLAPGERVALLGRNGVGKSTTLNLLRDVFADPDLSSQARFNPNTGLGFYDQGLIELEQLSSRFDWLHERSDAPAERVKQVLLQAGIAYQDFDQPVYKLSGGERARLMFMLFRLNRPSLLILDEPTNHLDLQGREQLEQQLLESGATLLLTGHDRRFIDAVAERWWLIENGELRELHDPELFYASLTNNDATAASQHATNSSTQQSDESTTVGEDTLLRRIEELEDLVRKDLARKTKHQKPAQRQRWQAELDTLWQQLDAD